MIFVYCIHPLRLHMHPFFIPSLPPDKRPKCPYIDPPDNGAQTLTGNVPGSVLNYTCNRGYKLVGNHIRHCKNTGYWNGSLPKCLSKEYA